jgi:hypothetical protein
MATQGAPLVDVDVTGGPLEGVEAIPVGDLIDLFVLTRPTISDVGAVNYGNRFPTPPSAFGFLTMIFDPEGDLPYRFDGLGPPYNIIGALLPEGQYLEPTIGQIWPRIG